MKIWHHLTYWAVTLHHLWPDQDLNKMAPMLQMSFLKYIFLNENDQISIKITF